MAQARFYSSIAQQTTLTGATTASNTSITVVSTAGFPGTTPYTLALDYGASNEELVDVTGVAGTTLTVTRAIDGTSGSIHNVGASVRHVSSARDFTESRQHEDSTEAHGATGAVVGTTNTQTLTNKTISGGTISGTVAGSPTYSGAVTFSGVANLNAGGALVGTFSGDHTLSGSVTFTGGGSLTGTFAGSPTFSGAPTFSGTTTHSGLIQSTRANSTDVALAAQVSADTFDRWRVYSSGLLEWGSGALARDTNLYRASANLLKTDDSLEVAGNATVTGNLTVVGVGQTQVALKTADTSRANTATATADPHLTVPVVANATYIVDGWLKYFAHPTPDFKMTLGTPAGTLGEWSGLGRGLSSAAETGSVNGYLMRTESNDINQERNFYGVTDLDMSMHFKATVRVQGTAGNLSINWSQGTSDATATVVYTDSWMRVQRIA